MAVPEKTEQLSERRGFDVVVEHVIGFVDIDSKKREHALTPIEAAMLVIGRHLDRDEGTDEFTFRFPVHGVEFTVNVTATERTP